MDDAWDHLAESAAATIDLGKWVRLHFGQLSRDIVQFERSTAHSHLAWIGTSHDGGGMIIDMRSIYAYEEIEPSDNEAA